MAVGLAAPTDAGEFGAHGTKVFQPPPAAADIAKHFPQLEILEWLGRGGMGVVYKARQPKLNRLVALKLLAPEKGADPRFAERFLREAQALARLSHANIVTVHDFGEADGLYYLLMEYVDGVTLRQLLQTRKMAPEEALKIVPKICEALQFAHEQGVVHRDIKPENVLLDKQGRVKIADFGIAKLVGAVGAGPALTEEQSVIGTPHYMAPEQVEKPQSVDHRADIYSLGVVFYEMLTGELPLGKFQPPSKKVQVDVRLDEVVLHALEKEPERRYQAASEVKTDLETIAGTPGASATLGKASPPVRILRWRDAWPWNNEYIQLFVLVPLIVVALAIPVCLHWWGLRALWLFGIEVPAFGFAIMYGVVGYRVRGKKAALAQPTGEVAECLMFRRPFQSPGLAVMHDDRLELIPIVGSPITVILADIVAVKEVRWFNGTRLWLKKGFVIELANGQRVGVAVAEVFARRWRARLSRGSLPATD
jgi:tRNA A-37 threonylcarbamoyl transferase component Bud32